MCSSIPIFSSFSHCMMYPLFAWIMDQILKAGPKVFYEGSSDSRDPVVAHFLNRKSLERWFHSCICHCVPVQAAQLELSTAAGSTLSVHPSGRVQAGVCSVSVPNLATRNAANYTKLLSVIRGSGDCLYRSFPYFLFSHLFTLYIYVF